MAEKLTKHQVDSLTIGETAGWHHDHQPSPRSDENAWTYRIDGMPPGLTASIDGIGKRWNFEVFRGNERMHRSDTLCYSKEKALQALKDWLKEADISVTMPA